MGKVEVKEERFVVLGKMVESLDLCKVVVIKQKQVEQLPHALPSEIKVNDDLQVVGVLPNYTVVLRDNETGQYKRNSLDVYLVSRMEASGMNHKQVNDSYNDWWQTAINSYRQLFYK